MAEPRPLLGGGRRGGLDRGGWRGGDGADSEAPRPPLRKHAAGYRDDWDEASGGGGSGSGDGMAEPRPLLPSAGDAALSAPALDRSSHSPVPFAAAKKVIVAVDRGSSRSPGPSASAAKKKAVVDRATGRPAPSATLPPKCHISMEPLVGGQAKQNRSRTESGQERCPTSGGETLPPNIQQTDVTSTPNLSQFLSSSRIKRKRTPLPPGMTEAGRAEQTFANDEPEEDVGDHHVNENLTAGLDGEMGDGWSEYGYGGENSDDEFDRCYTVEGVIGGFLHGEEDRQFRSKVWDEFTKVRVGGVVTKRLCAHCNAEISAKRGAGTSAMLTHLKRCKARLGVTQVTNQLKSTVMSPEGIASELAEAIQYMQRKFRRYWKLTWLQVSFPVIFDPRFKLKFNDFRLKQAFGIEAESKIGIVKNTLLELFKDYSAGQEITQAHCVVQTSTSRRYADWDDHVNLDTQATNEVFSEPEAYLSKQAIPRSEEFDILGWWKNNALKYPTLSLMARDVLVAPASSVPSEQAFSPILYDYGRGANI